MKCSGINCPMQYPYDVKKCLCVDTCPYATTVPYTNAERIRAMNDDELAELLISADFCEGCEYCDKVGIRRYCEAHPDGVLADGCKQAARKWLQQPAEED